MYLKFFFSQVDAVKTSLIVNAVVIKVNSLCSSCGFAISNVISYCYDDDTSITIRGTVETSLIPYLMTWVAGSPEVNVDGIQLVVDKSCAVVILFFDQDGCPLAAKINSNPSGPMAFRVGIGVGIGCLVLLAIIIALVIVSVRRRKLQGTKTLR